MPGELKLGAGRHHATYGRRAPKRAERVGRRSSQARFYAPVIWRVAE
jgi:hypothetical protein